MGPLVECLSQNNGISHKSLLEARSNLVFFAMFICVSQPAWSQCVTSPTRRTYSSTVLHRSTIKMAEEANKHLQESLQTTAEGVNDYYDQWGSSGQYDKVGS